MSNNKFYNFCKRATYLFAILLIVLLWINIIEVRSEYHKKNNIKPKNYIQLISNQSKIYIESIKYKIPSFRRK